MKSKLNILNFGQRTNSDLKLFEFGKTYHKYEKGYQEDKHLTIFVSGARTKDSWTSLTQNSDFFYLKGIIIALLGRLGIDRP